ncbi:MAG TPA: prepilin-type N-terminal cleavage/methylation domain-containing protein, partial [Bryobacteraceae bacterium]|nr:prepilin-type N-terminal cleavage/methylation domain-containing protein [Bryobacteraceae bacterium]
DRGAGTMTRRHDGFTLLEVLVATVVLALAISGTLSALSTSLRNAARLNDYDRAAMLGRRKLDELLLDRKLPKLVFLEGRWDPSLTGGRETGWRARITHWEMTRNPAPGPGSPTLERVQLELWWNDNERRRSFHLEGFRRGTLTEQDIAAGALLPQ